KANDELVKLWPQLWKAGTEEKQRELMKGLRTQADKEAMYPQLCRQLLAMINTDDLKEPAGRAKARAMVGFLERTCNVTRRAEMNYFMMLLRDWDPEPMPANTD